MSIPEACVEAAFATCSADSAKSRARRVILALAEEIPEDAVNAAFEEYLRARIIGGWKEWDAFRLAFSAFLKHVGETP